MRSLRKYIASVVTCAFVCASLDFTAARAAYASELSLPVPTQMVQVSQTFSYPVLKGLKIDPQDPLNLEFIIDTQDKSEVSEAEAQKLVNYFLAAVAVPQKDLWVNLSPYEKDRVVTDELGQTVLGEKLLAQDYLLKQLSSSLTNPNTELGKSYWNKVASTGSVTGSAETLKKIWIKPALAEVYEKGTQVFVTKATLDVESEASASSATEVLLPAIRKEVNEGEHFAPIRQAYYSIILGLWFKEKLRSSIFKDYIDAKHVNGIAQSAAQSKEEIFNAYVESFKKGAYNQTVKTHESGKLVKRAYFSGGFTVSSAVIDKKEMLPRNFAFGQLYGLMLRLHSLGKAPRFPPPVFDSLLAHQAIETGRVEIDDIADQKMREFLNFLKMHGLNDIVVSGGAVRDIFYGRNISDLDLMVKMDLNDEDFEVLRKNFTVSQAAFERGASAFEALATALGFPSHAFAKLGHSKLFFKGLELDNCGLGAGVFNDGKFHPILMRTIEKTSGQMINLSYGPMLLEMAIDSDGRLYGPYKKALNSAIQNQVGVNDDPRLFQIGTVLRFMRLHHEYGLTYSSELDSHFRAAVEKIQVQHFTPLLQTVLYKQIKALVLNSSDRSAVLRDLDRYGVLEIVGKDFSKRFWREIVSPVMGTGKASGKSSSALGRVVVDPAARRELIPSMRAGKMTFEASAVTNLNPDIVSTLRAFSAKPTEEQESDLAGREKYKVYKNGDIRALFEDGILISHITRDVKDLQAALIAKKERFKERLGSDIANKVIFLDENVYHVTTIDLAGLPAKYKTDAAKGKILKFQKKFFAGRGDVPLVKARVVGIDMFARGIIKFNVAVENRAVLDEIARDFWRSLAATDTYFTNIEADVAEVSYKPQDVVYHISLGYLYESLSKEEAEILIRAMEKSFAEDPITFDLSAGKATEFSGLHTLDAIDVSASSSVEGGVDLKKMTVKSAAGSSAIELNTAGIDPTMFKGGLSFMITSLEKVSSERVLAGLR